MYELIVLLILVVAIVLVTARWKISPFLALIGAAILAAFAYRIPLAEVAGTVTTAFGTTMGNIGLVILFGTMIGIILERSGAAISMADALIKVLGTRFPNLTLTIIGYIVSIPVFCDSGYVVLNSLRKAITLRTGVSGLATSVALMTGLYATHTMVPPTPGPLAAAESIGIADNLGLIIAVGLPVAAISALAGLFYASRFNKSQWTALPSEDENDLADLDYEQLRASFGKLPHPALAFLPILVPLVLICASSIAKLPSQPLGGGTLVEVLSFLGTPVIALIFGLLSATLLLRGENKLGDFNEQMHESVRTAAPILLITGAGAALGAVLAASELTTILSDSLSGLGLGLAVPFLIAAALKSAQGSSTVSMVTTSALVAPMLGSLGLDSELGMVLSVLAVGAGAMVVSHANDSYFWVVSQLSRIPVITAYKTLSVATAIQGTAAFATVWILGAVLL
ncbi:MULTISPECIES: GntP family permease [Glutamicibacter]|uniref:GntP family permease n=1 Tax=Glutamicibacter halophytocola TaxID=1933880 RepID=A0AA94XX25_9MICC|nr:GntP family permease [Glutamicibacter halophytocola]ALG30509.1 gluconate transporter [Glutamicibacter halophytocola]MBF6670304.1 GntP family permease [Glutamicibacter sp. FBE19]UUX58898.1 GntP family permease [Glutamicibacter halophytocola]